MSDKTSDTIVVIYLLTTAELRRIYGDEQALDTPLLCMVDEFAGDFTLLVHVTGEYQIRGLEEFCGIYSQLQELVLTWCGRINDLVERT